MSFSLAIAGAIAAVVGYADHRLTDLFGGGLAVCLLGIGVGLIAWAKSLGLDDHAVQEREPLAVSEAEQEELHDELHGVTVLLRRRRLISALFGGSVLGVVVAFFGPLGSLGPTPGAERRRTSWKPGSRLVTGEGVAVKLADRRTGQLVTVFPEGAIGADNSQVVLMRLPIEAISSRTRAAGTPEGWVAYSKICTHAGCSVGLLGIDNRPPVQVTQLVCPCHQSVFDPLDAARPVGGPATRSLPQLGLDVDADGYLVARADFDRPVGPLAWDEA